MLSQKDKHDKIYDQLVYELFCDPLPKRTTNKKPKSTTGLCKRARFLQKMKEQKIKDPDKK